MIVLGGGMALASVKVKVMTFLKVLLMTSERSLHLKNSKVNAKDASYRRLFLDFCDIY